MPLDSTVTPQHHSSTPLPISARTSHLWTYHPAVMSVMERLMHHDSQLWRLCVYLLEDDPQTIPRSWGFTFSVDEGIGEWPGKKVYKTASLQICSSSQAPLCLRSLAREYSHSLRPFILPSLFHHASSTLGSKPGCHFTLSYYIWITGARQTCPHCEDGSSR